MTSTAPKPPTICLNMIVKNEHHVIRRCLDSVCPILDYWVIIDTGSTDGTQDLIRSHMATRGIPGELIERPWVDFGHNRTEALSYARGKADYLFIIDADEVLALQDGFSVATLTHRAYEIRIRSGNYCYWRTQLVSSRLPWRYRGVLHEYLELPDAEIEPQRLDELVTHRYLEGARSRDPLTYQKDAILLERALLDEPDNKRYVFCLAQSYRDAGMLDRAIACYRRRAEMGGWAEAVWYALYQIAELMQRQEHDWTEVLTAYLEAYEYRPHRAEPLYRIALHYQRAHQFQLASLFLERAMQIPYPEQERIFVDAGIYEHLLPIEAAVSCYWTGRHDDAIRRNNALMQDPRLPAELLDLVVRNRRFSLDARRVEKGAVVSVDSVIALVTFDQFTPELDDCIDSLENLSPAADQVVYLSAADEALREVLPEGETSRFVEVRDDAWGDTLLGCLDQIVTDDDVVFLLRGKDGLASNDRVGSLRRCFEDGNCDVAFSQYRYANGRYGLAQPPADSADLDCSDGIANLRPYAFAFRGRHYHSQRRRLASQVGGKTEREPAVRTLVAGLLGSTDCTRVEFVDSVQYVYNESPDDLEQALATPIRF